IEVEGVEVIRRQHARERAEPEPLARDEGKQPLHHGALEIGKVPVDAYRAPEVGKTLARLVGAAANEPIREHDGVDRSRGGAGDALDLDPAIAEQLIEHPPGECSVSPAALQGKIDALAATGWSGRRGGQAAVKAANESAKKGDE